MGQVKSVSPRWTPAQQRAIEDEGGTLLVSAAAGSGKTAVLVNRALRLICREQNPIPAEQLLIVTFTNAAAAELRGRLSKGLAQAVQEAGRESAGRQSFLRRQQMMLGRAAIGTMDAFCLSLLQQNFRALEIPPDFSTADEGTLFELQTQALDEVLTAAYQEPDFCAFADLYGKSRSDRKAGETILSLYRFLRSLPEYRRWLDERLLPWKGELPVGETIWAQYLMEEAQAILQEAVQYEQGALRLCTLAQKDGLDSLASAYLPFFEAEEADIKTLETLASEKKYEALAVQMAGFAWRTLPRLSSKPKKNASEDEVRFCAQLESSKEEIKEIRQKAKDLTKSLERFFLPQSDFEEDRRTAAPLMNALAKAVKAFDERYFALKVERKVLEFSDFEHLALQLLWNGEKGCRTSLARQLSKTYRVVMVDEYQDTNRLQDLLYYCLASEAQDNLFFVGDIKQGIYGFRQADPEIFQEKREHFALIENPQAERTGQCYPACLLLDKNFRSAPGVIRAVNGFFDAVMSRRVGGVEYADTKGEQLSSPEGASQGGGGCELHLVQSSDGTDANAVAARIALLLQDGATVSEGGETRPCRPEDFCILLRARQNFDVYVQALAARGLSAYADVNENLLDAPAVRPLVSLLRVLDNPAQDVPLASVLLSPLGGMTPGELTRLRANHPAGNLYAALLPAWRNNLAFHSGEKAQNSETAEPHVDEGMASLQDTAEEKALTFYNKLSLLRSLSQTMPADQLLEEIYTETNYPALAGAMPGGSVRRDEVRRFTEFASQAGAGGLSALVRVLDAIEASESPVASLQSSAGARPGLVSIMTIHRSKGLEFPFVILADTARLFNMSDQMEPVLFHRRLGLGLKLRGEGGLYPTLALTAVLKAKKAEALSEEMRVLYVALTRAKEKLLLFVPYKTEKEGEEGKKSLTKLLEGPARALQCGAGRAAAAHASASGTWLLLGAMSNQKGRELWKEAGIEPPPLKADWPLELFLEDDEPVAAQEIRRVWNAPPDPVLLAGLRQTLSWKYPHLARTKVAAKVSVTAVVHREEREVLMERPAFLMKDGLTGAEKGTALHAFLEHADFASAKRDPRVEAERQKTAGLLEESQADKLDFTALKTFFESDLFSRMEKTRRLLREYDFISAVSADELTEQAEEKHLLQKEGDRVLLQGVADLVLVFDDHVEIADYKTDHGKKPADFLSAYAGQLQYYARAISRRMQPLPVTRCTLYSCALGQEIDVPLAKIFKDL